MDYAPLTLVAVAAVSLAAGAFGGMLGVGGGIILVPVMVGVLGIPLEEARSASLVSVIVTSLGSSLVYLKDGITDLERAGPLQLPTAVGAVGGALLGTVLNACVVAVLFAILILIVSWQMLAQRGTAAIKVPGATWVWAGFACVFGGTLGSLLGVGGGLIFVPVMALLFGSEQRVASATSAFLIGMTAAPSALIYQLSGHLHPWLGVSSAGGIFLGALVGARVSGLLSGRRLRVVFSLVMVATALLLLNRVVRGDV
ncbi:MAG: hypothetical protein C4341_07965 [Armatimonadota bacterium]